jgi:cyclopropane fatty-acyl-phospholipid synthase-like methyltransferase
MTIWGTGPPAHGETASAASVRGSMAGLVELYVPLKHRLSGWWNGTFSDVKPPGTGDRRLRIDVDANEDGEPKSWSPTRLKIAQDVFGDGFIEPGGAPFARKLLAPADADPSKTILDLSVGLGGTAIAIAREHEVWMEALEPESRLVDRTREFVRSNMLSRRINIKPVDYATFSPKNEKYDVIYSRDRLFTTAHKPRIISQVGSALKKNGKLLIIDYMVASHDNAAPEYQNWIAAEPERAVPWTEARYLEAFSGAGLKLRASQDFSPQYVEQIESGWHKMLRDLEANEIDRAYVNALIREGELWLARSRALEAGVVKVIRLLASRG